MEPNVGSAIILLKFSMSLTVAKSNRARVPLMAGAAESPVFETPSKNTPSSNSGQEDEATISEK